MTMVVMLTCHIVFLLELHAELKNIVYFLIYCNLSGYRTQVYLDHPVDSGSIKRIYFSAESENPGTLAQNYHRYHSIN